MGCNREINQTLGDINPNNFTIYAMPVLNDTTIEGNDTYSVKQIQYLCDEVINPIILFFGVIGNAASVAVLRRKRLRHSIDEVEQSATSGLVCLALSDTAFCAIGLIAVLMPSQYTTLQDSTTWALISMYYTNFKAPLLNIFMLTSTWMIIVTSIGRYMAIADPFNAKFLVSVKHKYILPAAIFFISLLINFPQFMFFRIVHGSCYDGCYCYFRVPGLFHNSTWYHIIWHIIGTLIPLVILIYCNCRLLYQVYRSLHGSPHRYSTSKITVILVSIITLFLVLVCPSMILTFLSNVTQHRDDVAIYRLRIAVSITNTLQSLNFAINFVLYSCISKQFRQMLLQTLCCNKPTKHKKRAPLNANIGLHQYQLVRFKVQDSWFHPSNYNTTLI